MLIDVPFTDNPSSSKYLIVINIKAWLSFAYESLFVKDNETTTTAAVGGDNNNSVLDTQLNMTKLAFEMCSFEDTVYYTSRSGMSTVS